MWCSRNAVTCCNSLSWLKLCILQYYPLPRLSHRSLNSVQSRRVCIATYNRVVSGLSCWAGLGHTFVVNYIKNRGGSGEKWPSPKPHADPVFNNSYGLPAYHPTARHSGAFEAARSTAVTFKLEMPHIISVCTCNDQLFFDFPAKQESDSWSQCLASCALGKREDKKKKKQVITRIFNPLMATLMAHT